MKNIVPFIALAFLLGCASVQTNAGKLLATTAVTVDGSMQGWATWVNLNQATPDQETKVRDAYSKYQASMTVAKKAYNTLVTTGDQSAWLQASTVLEANQATFIALVRTFMTGGAK